MARYPAPSPPSPRSGTAVVRHNSCRLILSCDPPLFVFIFLVCTLSARKTPPTLYPNSEGFCTKLFSEKITRTFNCTIFTAFVRKNFGRRKKPLITDRDKNCSFDSLFSKSSEFFIALKQYPSKKVPSLHRPRERDF